MYSDFKKKYFTENEYHIIHMLIWVYILHTEYNGQVNVFDTILITYTKRRIIKSV